jgi:hypothetical protein
LHFVGSADQRIEQSGACPINGSGNPGKPHVEVIVHGTHHFVEFILIEMVGARDLVMVDRDVLLRAQLIDQLLHRIGRDDRVGCALHDDAAGRARARKLKSYMLAGDTLMKPRISGRRIKSCIAISAPKL